MTIYYFLSLAFFLLSLLEIYILGGDRSLRLYKTASLWPIGVVLVCIAGLRYMVGADYTSYLEIFKWIAQFDNLPDAISGMGVIEPAFVTVNFLLKSLPYNAFLFLFAIPSIFFKLRWIAKYSPYIFLALFLYLPTFLEGDMGIIRQYFALGLICWSVDFIDKRRLLPFLVLVILAFNFHRSAIIFLPAYFLVKIRINYWHALILVTLMQVTSFINMDFLKPIAQLNSFMYGKFQDYSTYKDLGFGIKDIARILILLLVALNQKVIKQDKTTRLFADLFMWGCLIYALLKFNAAFAQRLTLYYLRAEIILLPCLLYQLGNSASSLLKINSYRIIIVLYAIIVLCYKIYILIPWNDNYQFIFLHD
ncbi:EpsG family protein [Taibaiella koreensis]|uniref:EpsG family protein n=1 Tax=Taibaiella koreensis TaxID=1268548 RepID=UPI000E59D8B4|nr:EpsG family protein [Taibaiella koreensis]